MIENVRAGITEKFLAFAPLAGTLQPAMMMTEKELKRLAQEVTGLDDPAEAFEETLRAYIDQKLAHYRLVIEELEEAHGVPFEKFSAKLGKELPLTWKNEQDFSRWEEAITNSAHFEEIASQLKIHA